MLARALGLMSAQSGLNDAEDRFAAGRYMETVGWVS